LSDTANDQHRRVYGEGDWHDSRGTTVESPRLMSAALDGSRLLLLLLLVVLLKLRFSRIASHRVASFASCRQRQLLQHTAPYAALGFLCESHAPVSDTINKMPQY